jgi:hypothetical protein
MRSCDFKHITEDCTAGSGPLCEAEVFCSGIVHGAVAILCFLAVPTVFAQDLRTQCGVHSKTQVEAVDSSHSSYNFRMGGKIDGEMTRDPMGYWAYDQYWEPNVSVRMENVGDTPVVNPWLQRAGSTDTRSLKSIVDSIVRPEMSDKEKARRLWEYEIATRFHATTQDDEVADVVKRVNAYGYTLCYDESKDLSDLWRAAGLKVRKGYPNGHSLAEVFYEGGWHLLDSDESIVSLLRDNETIASEAQVVADHDLMKRTHTYGILANDNRLGDESSAALLYWEGERSGEQPSLTTHTMDFTLRPGESITWAWNQGNRYHAMPFAFGDEDADGWNKHWRVIAHVMNGEMTYAPDLSKDAALQYLHIEGVEKQTSGAFGEGLYLRSERGTVDVPVKSAYPIVGGRLDADFARLDPDGEGIDASISFDEGKHWIAVWSSTAGDYSRIYADLDPFFKKTDSARYEYTLRLTLRSPAKRPLVALKGFYLRSTLQMAPLAMPGVKLGDNQFVYSDSNSDARKVRITHTWNECEADVSIPQQPVGKAPEDGKAVSGTRVRFEWTASGKPAPADYEFELSEFADMRWALSSNFHKLISRTAERSAASYVLPQEGLLNPGQPYYWRVRARSRDGVWGAWSKAYSFTAAAPAVAVNLNASFDADRRAVRLTWQPGQGGTEPMHFKIYGSAERGFSANDQPYEYNAGLNGTLHAPANLLLETAGPTGSLAIPVELWRPYYRVVAVDREGRVSGVSAMAELPHPLITTRELPAARRRQFYEARIETSASAGHLVSADEDGKSYQLRYRTGDDLVYSLEGGPGGLSIDGTGLISGFIGAAEKDKWLLRITVRSKAGGAGDSAKLNLSVVRDNR